MIFCGSGIIGHTTEAKEDTVSLKTRATIDDLYRVEGKAELVHGEIVPMAPTGDDPGRASLKVAAQLLRYEQRTGIGRAYPDGNDLFE